MKLSFILLILLLAVAGPAAGETQQAENGDAIFSLLKRSASTVKTLTSDFVQEKYLSMFKSVLTSKGHFYFNKPDMLRWELTAPVASGFVLKGDAGRRWHERTGRTENFRISQEPVMKIVSEQLFAWAKPDFQWLKKEYKIVVLKESPVSLRLEPRSATLQGFIHYLLVNFSADGKYVRSVELHEKDGDYTRIRFVNTVVNKPLQVDFY